MIESRLDEIRRPCFVVWRAVAFELSNFAALEYFDLTGKTSSLPRLLKNQEVNAAARQFGIHRTTFYRTFFSELFLVFKKKGLDEYV